MFTRSELVLTAWRSQEVSQNLSRRAGPRKTAPSAEDGYSKDDLEHYISTRDEEILERRLGAVAYKLENKETGDVDLRQLTGAEAMQFMGAMGLDMGRQLG